MAIPGVPTLLAGEAFVSGAVSMLTADSYSYFAGAFSPQWGIFQNGFPVVIADTVASVEYRKDWVIGDYPVEGGSFQSYDKVEEPFDARIRFVAGGSEANRMALLYSVEAIAGNTQLYDVATPERVYSPASIRHYDYHRTATNGLGMIVVDVWIYEIRQAQLTSSGSGDYSGQNAAQPSGADSSNGGSVQTDAATAANTNTVAAGVGGDGIPSFAGTTSINFIGSSSPYGTL